MNESTSPTRKSAERFTRWLVLVIFFGLPALTMAARWLSNGLNGEPPIEIHAVMPEKGGWLPSEISAEMGKPLRLRLISDDVMHGFAIGQSDQAAIDLTPGKPVEATLVFDRPGKYTYYCTRWCGVNHWRMRGTIEVKAPEYGEAQGETKQTEQNSPLFVTLGIDIDAPHPAKSVPSNRPSVERGAEIATVLPSQYSEDEYTLTHSPAEIWSDLREEPNYADLSDQQIWDLIAWNWRQSTSTEKLQLGAELYRENCAACHGENGDGNGVMAIASKNQSEHVDGHSLVAPVDFRDPSLMLGASPAVLQGKIIRGGMGTGMPYWGPIFTDEQIQALVDYLWTFQFESEEIP